MPSALLTILLALAPPQLAEPWQAAYSGPDANGPQVVGLWTFDQGAETKDSAGRQKPGTLRGGRFAPEGKFGGCLESGPGWPVADKPHGLQVPPDASLSPAGAFTIELWLRLDAKADEYANTAHLLDCKYTGNNHTGWNLLLSPASKAGLRHLTANLGFGDATSAFTSEVARFEPGRWTHLAFTYDGEGNGRFFRDGMAFGGGEAPGRKGIRPAKHALVIGDRVGSYYAGVPGSIDNVRLCSQALEFRRAGIARRSDRSAFRRYEYNARVLLAVTNLQRTALTGASVSFTSGLGPARKTALPELAPGAEYLLPVPLDTTLRPGEYVVTARLELPGGESGGDELVPYVLVGRPMPERMPVVMWGVGSSGLEREAGRLGDLGFTHCLGGGADYEAIWQAGKPVVPGKPESLAFERHALDVALAGGISFMSQLTPGRWARGLPDLRRVQRDGKPYGGKDPDMCGLAPKVADFCRNVGTAVAQAYSDLPAWEGALIHTEVRSESRPCFHAWDREAFQKFAGYDIPESIPPTLNGKHYSTIKGFPADRVIPDDDPFYRYYQWFWRQGDGWNGLHSAVNAGLHSTGRPDVWTWHDPTMRGCSVYGQGGEVDVLSHWTYTNPEPIRIGLCTDELLCMAAGAARPQQVMKMTQLFWYRSQTAPKPKAGAKPGAASPWEDQDPDADYITISPMHLREALWTKLSRPVRGIMYHGWGALVPEERRGGYRYTHPETQHEFRRLMREVVQPLGPMLRQVPGVPSDIAVLHSFASEIYAQRGTFGWNGSWIGDMYLVLCYAQLHADVVFDETVMKQGLDRYKLLVMPDCDVLTAGVVKAVKAFQARGGLVIGDERLCPGIKPDIVVPAYERKRVADEDKAELLKRAAQLRQDLGGRYTRFVDSDNPEVVTHYRRAGDADYVFAVNDHREYGGYVGAHHLVMENGLPAEANVLLNRAGVVYDVTAGRPVRGTREQVPLKLPLALEPGDGKLLLVLPQPIAAVKLAVPATATVGRTLEVALTINGLDGRPLNAVFPLRLDLLDPDGRPAEFSGYHAAAGGQLKLKLDLAPNETCGLWTIRARELASDLTAVAYVRVGGR